MRRLSGIYKKMWGLSVQQHMGIGAVYGVWSACLCIVIKKQNKAKGKPIEKWGRKAIGSTVFYTLR